MSDAAAKAKTDADKKKPKAPVTAAAFAEVTSGMSRFLSKLSDFGPFREANIGIAEWSVMNALVSGDGSNKQLSRDLGITKQRVNQICETLKKSGYVSVAADADDSRKHAIKLTPTGTSQLSTLNAKVTPILVNGLQGKERALDMATKSLKALTRVISEPKSDADKQARAEKKAGKPDKDKKEGKEKKDKSAKKEA